MVWSHHAFDLTLDKIEQSASDILPISAVRAFGLNHTLRHDGARGGPSHAGGEDRRLLLS